MHFSKRIALRGINKGLVINDNRDNLRSNQIPRALEGKQHYTIRHNATPHYSARSATTLVSSTITQKKAAVWQPS